MPLVKGIKDMIDRQQEQSRKELEQKKKEIGFLFHEKARVHIKVKGVVQGVFFRAFVKKSANIFNVSGSVQNKSDGSVEIIAEGERPKLEKLLEKCRQGPPAAVVKSVDHSWHKYRGEFTDFSIIY